MKQKLSLFAASALLSAATLFAQEAAAPPPPPAPPMLPQAVPDRVSRLTALLSLTSAQQASITTIFTNEATAAQDLRTSMQTARQSLQTAIQAGDSSGVASAAQEIGQLTTRDVQNHAQAQVDFLKILTSQQKAKLQQALPPPPPPAPPQPPAE